MGDQETVKASGGGRHLAPEHFVIVTIIAIMHDHDHDNDDHHHLGSLALA